MPNSLSVTIRDRSGILFQGEAQAVSSQNEKGPFDILPEHAHFISTLTEKVVIHLSTGEQTFSCSKGMISTVEDEVTILLGVTPQ